MGTLKCSDVSVRLNGRTLLDGVDITVEHGTACALMGPSGAGKSTLLRAVAGLLTHRGRVAVDDRDLTGIAPHRRGIGLLFQHARLFPNMSTVDNVAYPLRLQGLRRRERRAEALELLETVGLADRSEARSHELSGGEQQRVALARAMCSQPDVMMLDEPLTNLDLVQRRELVQVMKRVRSERQLTWLIVTHEPDDAAALADTIAILDEGRLVQHDSVDELRARPRTQLAAAMSANPNVLRGEVCDGFLSLGPLRVPTRLPNGPVAYTLGVHQLWLHRPSPEAVRLPMRVVAVEPRGPSRVVRAVSSAGIIEIPTVEEWVSGERIDVWFDAGDLWPISTASSPSPATARQGSIRGSNGSSPDLDGGLGPDCPTDVEPPERFRSLLT